jgi:hypothetical protein
VASLLLPKSLGAVRVGERLGEGGMALVHRCMDPFRPDRGLAAKLLKPEVHGDEELVKRFLREGEVLQRLSHAHLVEVFAYGRAGSWPYLLMELLPGGSLKACMGEPPAALVRRLHPVTEAIGVAHAAGIIHRDLKPSNLLFAEDGRLKVTDFGVCLWEGAEGTRVTRSSMVVGTVGFMAPEQHGDPRRVDARADVYALSAILFEYTTGQAWAQVQLPPASVRPGFPPRLAGLLMRGLQADPARRLPSMDALRDALSEWLESAEAAGWGEEPLPGWRMESRDQPTVAGPRSQDAPDERLGPYVDALSSGPVGARRAAAEGLRQAVKVGDGDWLLEALTSIPESARFGVCAALGEVGEAKALSALLALRDDPYCAREALESAARIALRTGRDADVRSALWEGDLGQPLRWGARALLGDEGWVGALRTAWPKLSTTQRLQALEAARQLPESLRASVKSSLGAGLSGAALEAWQRL